MLSEWETATWVKNVIPIIKYRPYNKMLTEHQNVGQTGKC